MDLGTAVPTGAGMLALVLVIACGLGAVCGWGLTLIGRRVLTSLRSDPRALWPTWVTVGVTALVWVLQAWWCLMAGQTILLIMLLPMTSGCVLLWQIDQRHHRLPNVIVLSLYPIVGLGLVIATLMTGRAVWMSIAAGSAVWLAVFMTMLLLSRGRGIGLGDVKLSPVIGAVLGWFSLDIVVLGLVAAFTMGGLWAIVLLVSRRVTRHSAIAFGPFMIVGLGVGVASGLALAG
jgi:leader peptidase (prepilin peptidase)/N-methyltransferase